MAHWLTDPEAHHGLIVVPLALAWAWRTRRRDAEPRRWLGATVILGAVALRFLADLAAEPYTVRLSAVLALAGLTLYYVGSRQLRAWTLPLVLLVLAIPLPSVVTGTASLPLQMIASRMGATLLEARHVPVVLSGNIINLPGHELFVTEACSGLRSLGALVSLGVVLAGMAARGAAARASIIAASIPIAILVNGLRVFLTGFLVYYAGTDAASGFLHATEGLILFMLAFVLLGLFAWMLASVERWIARRGGSRVDLA